MAGLVLTAVDASSEPHQWIFRFGEGCFVNVESVWRIVKENRVVLECDWTQRNRCADVTL
jgi:hypothetical protein